MDKSVVIIGAGIGGLTTACLLCKEGYKVTVLDKHYMAGGGLHTFKKNGVSFESGIHIISGFQPGGVLRRMFKYFGIFDCLNIKMTDADAFDIIKVGKNEYRMARGKEPFIAKLSTYFPHERENIRRYIDAMYAIAEKFYLCNMRLPDADIQSVFYQPEVMKSVAAFIADYIQDERLRNLLAWSNPLYSGTPEHSPMYIHAIISRFYIEGEARFVGGGQQLADAMCEMIRAHGGDVILADGVTKIEVENKKIQRLITEQGKIYTADYYISSLHPKITLSIMSQIPFNKAYCERVCNTKLSYSAFCLYLKMKKNSFPYINSNVFCVDDFSKIWKVSEYSEQWPQGFMLMTPPKSQNDQYAETVLVHSLVGFEVFEKWIDTNVGNRGADYLAKKKAFEQQVLKQVEKFYPGISEKIETCVSATPLTIRDFTGSPCGSLYGNMKIKEELISAFVMPRTKVENFFFTGQNINLHGILGVPLNSIMTVAELTGGISHLINKINQADEQY